jgi:hypothetical protein
MWVARLPSAPTLTFQENVSMDIYHPTYLYVKRHKITGLKYFGKTTKNNVVKYKGSGKKWLNHLNFYGNEVETVWVSESFQSKELLNEFALFFSEFFNIVESDEWANLIPENGFDGAPMGLVRPEEFRSKFKGEKNPMYGKENPFKGKKHTDEQKLLWSIKKKGVPQGPKSEECKLKLRKPKSNKQNYKGSPGKITCINKQGIAVQISKDVYNLQKMSGLPMCEYEYVNTNSKEARSRKIKLMNDK